MSKKIKMCLYGEPGVGKSVFASKAPKPFFITTDGNYEWLEDFGADMNAHKQVNSWSEAKKAFAENYDDYETIVVDLTEDLFKWCEQEYCVKNRIDHVSDIGYGKGYDTTRNEFFLEICKLIAMDKHIIFIMHGITQSIKDRRGVEKTIHIPTTRIPDKVLDMIEGRVRYFLRCYLKAEESEDKTLIKKRYLSLIPKENEFGICRGIDESKVPHDIPLDFNIFAQCIGLDTKTENKPVKVKIEKLKVEPEISVEEIKEEVKEEIKEEPQKEIKEEVKEEVKEETKEEVKEEVKKQEPTEVKSTNLSNEDKLAAIRAKLAAIKAKNNE